LLTRLRRLGLPILLALAALTLAACGQGSEEDAKATLDKAFSTSIGSADVSLDLELKLDGISQLKDPIRVKLTGPYKTNGGEKLPSFDWDLSIQAGGQSFTAGAISTGDNAWIIFQGQAYEVGAEAVKQANDQIRKSSGGKKKSLADFGIDPRRWLNNPEQKGDETVAGAKTTHISSGVDVGKLLDDINKAISQAGGQLGSRTPSVLTDAQKKKVEEVLKDPHFDVYVGKDDNKVRRLSARVEFNVPEKDRASVGGLKGGTLSFEIEFANIGAAKDIKAPANAKPISELSQALQGLGLGGLGGVNGGSGSSGSGSSGSGSSGSGGGDAAKFQAYNKCLQDANPSDVAALQKCAELLK
jgi:hypothetical protein